MANMFELMKIDREFITGEKEREESTLQPLQLSDCVRVGRQRSRATGNPRFKLFENRVLCVAQTWLNGISPRLENLLPERRPTQTQTALPTALPRVCKLKTKETM
jgi:hypothetical protein